MSDWGWIPWASDPAKAGPSELIFGDAACDWKMLLPTVDPYLSLVSDRNETWEFEAAGFAFGIVNTTVPGLPTQYYQNLISTTLKAVKPVFGIPGIAMPNSRFQVFQSNFLLIAGAGWTCNNNTLNGGYCSTP